VGVRNRNRVYIVRCVQKSSLKVQLQKSILREACYARSVEVCDSISSDWKVNQLVATSHNDQDQEQSSSYHAMCM
jgi:hypothetical protein